MRSARSLPITLFLGWTNYHSKFCMANTITINNSGGNKIDVSSNRLRRGDFSGNTSIEFTFVGSVNGALTATSFQSPENSAAAQDLVVAVEDLVAATISHKEANRVALRDGMRPSVDIITDIGMILLLGICKVVHDNAK